MLQASAVRPAPTGYSSLMDLAALYDDWRARHGNGWGLSWYLAAEIVRRYATRVGLVAVPFEHEGVGWYGVMLFTPDAQGVPHPLGRITASGDAERWAGSEHDRLGLAERARAGESPSALVAAAIVHLRLEGLPRSRAHRAGAHVLGMEVCARVALRVDTGALTLRTEGHPQARQAAPPIRIEGPTGPGLRLTGDARLLGDVEPVDLLARWRAGADAAELADQVVVMLTGARTSAPGDTDGYALADHRHRYAAWCAARAAGRGLPGGTNAAFRAALEASELPALLRGSVEQWPWSAALFDRAHQRWCGAAVGSLHAQGATAATFGRAAKLVAIYIKTLVVCGGHEGTRLARVAHPPIDRVLLQALSRQQRFPDGERAMWRSTVWTTMGVDAYDEVILSLRSVGLDADGFWRAERWWFGEDEAG